MTQLHHGVAASRPNGHGNRECASSNVLTRHVTAAHISHGAVRSQSLQLHDSPVTDLQLDEPEPGCEHYTVSTEKTRLRQEATMC